MREKEITHLLDLMSFSLRIRLRIISSYVTDPSSSTCETIGLTLVAHRRPPAPYGEIHGGKLIGSQRFAERRHIVPYFGKVHTAAALWQQQ
jgi:hypothetical protein